MKILEKLKYSNQTSNSRIPVKPNTKSDVKQYAAKLEKEIDRNITIGFDEAIQIALYRAGKFKDFQEDDSIIAVAEK